MPLTFIDIEKQKTWRIVVLLLFLMLLYFVVCLTFAIPSMPHMAIFSNAAESVRFLFFIVLIALCMAATHFLFSGYNAVNNVIRTLQARPPDPDDELHKIFVNIVQEIHVVTGNARTMQFAVIPTLSMNALAAADLKGNAVIAITEGLLSRLSRSQLETVVAHEAHHILSGDCLETTVAASLFGSLSSLMDRASKTQENYSFLPPVFWPAWLALKASSLLNMFISREREYRADAAAVRMTRNPVALAETLYLLSRNWRGAGFIGSGFESLCIINPTATALDENEGFLADLFSTHPPIQRRIDVLLNMAHTDITALDAKMTKAENATASPQAAGYYAMDPQQQWQGPFSLGELGALPWLSPLTWIRRENQQSTDRAWKDPVINTIFVTKLAQAEKKSTDVVCPNCHQPLIMETYEGTQIYQCRFCAGMLVDNDKIPRILARAGRERPCAERVKALAKSVTKENQFRFAQQKLLKQNRSVIPLLPCPKCKNPMYRGFYSAALLIEIDRCSFCGITWFNQDEIEMLQCLIHGADRVY